MTRASLVALALVALACRGASDPPVRRDAIRFSHASHLRAGQACLQCHERAANPASDPARTRGVALPAQAVCLGCHERPAERECAYCHTEPRAPRSYPPRDRELVFDHGPHVARERGGCVSCHATEADPRSVRRFEPAIPTMSACADRCHGDAMRALNCSLCHTSLARYGAESVSLARHGPGFARHHGAEARAGGGLCAQCHDPSFCSRCHTPTAGAPLADFEPTAVARDFVHRGDFQARHADEARLTQNTCVRCHGVDACDACHRTSGVGGSVGPRGAHPVGWLDPLSPRGHAREARRNILACASCHESDAATTCAPCHRVGGAAGNPHPPGFSAGFDPSIHAVCLVCHAARP